MPSSTPVHDRRLSVEDVEIDEALPSYEDAIQEGLSTTIAVATAANSRYRAPSHRPGSSCSQQYSSLLAPSTASSFSSPQQYSSPLGPSLAPTIVTSHSFPTATLSPSSPITRGQSPQEPQAPRSPQPKYSSLLPPAPGPAGPPPNYNVTTSSLPEPRPSRKGKEREKESRVRRWIFGETTSQAYRGGNFGKKYAPAKNEGVPLEEVVDRFGNRKRELKFEMACGRGISVAGFVKMGVKYSQF